MSNTVKRSSLRSGSTLLEFVLAGSFIFLPQLAGTASIGLSTLRAAEVAALNRSAGHMFAAGVDFSQSANRNLLLKIAGSLNISDAGGQGVIILSEIDGTGVNHGVIARRITIGNSAQRASSFGTPAGGLLDAAGKVTDLSSPSANADSFAAVVPLAQGDVFYVAEAYFSTSDYDWTGVFTSGGIYTKCVF